MLHHSVLDLTPKSFMSSQKEENFLKVGTVLRHVQFPCINMEVALTTSVLILYANAASM